MKKTITRAALFDKIDDCHNRIERGEDIIISQIETTSGEILSGEVKFGISPDNNLPVALIVKRKIWLTAIKKIQIGGVEYEVTEE